MYHTSVRNKYFLEHAQNSLYSDHNNKNRRTKAAGIDVGREEAAMSVSALSREYD
jgi:hypothetical protein